MTASRHRLGTWQLVRLRHAARGTEGGDRLEEAWAVVLALGLRRGELPGLLSHDWADVEQLMQRLGPAWSELRTILNELDAALER